MERKDLQALAHISDADLETAPFGIVVVDAVGTIERYNQYESDLSHLSAKSVIGKNFFKTVAPCTQVSAFEGRFKEFLALGDPLSDSFAYFFPFAHGDANVLVTFVRQDGTGSTLIVVERVDEAVIEPLVDFYSPINPR